MQENRWHRFATLSEIELNTRKTDFVTIRVKVKPNSKISSFEETEEGIWLARIKSPPIDGKANAELEALIAKRFDRPKSAVSIQSGASGRVKLVRIETD